MDERICRLCIALAREPRSYGRTADEMVADAQAIVRAGDAAREALERGRSPNAAFGRARRLLEPYRIQAVERGDLRGTVLGLAFTSPHYLSGADNVYKVA